MIRIPICDKCGYDDNYIKYYSGIPARDSLNPSCRIPYESAVLASGYDDIHRKEHFHVICGRCEAVSLLPLKTSFQEFLDTDPRGYIERLYEKRSESNTDITNG